MRFSPNWVFGSGDRRAADGEGGLIKRQGTLRHICASRYWRSCAVKAFWTLPFFISIAAAQVELRVVATDRGGTLLQTFNPAICE